MSQECLASSKRLLEAGHYRRSISSAYYAAYCAVTGELAAQGVTFAHGWNNPAQDQLPDLILNNMSRPRSTRFRLNSALRLLRRAREDADYRPGAAIDQAVALNCLRHASRVLNTLEIEEDGTN